MDTGLVGSEYAGHLTDADIRLLAGAAGRGSLPDGGSEDAGPGWLRRDPSLLPALLSDPGVARAVLGSDGDQVDPAPASPFLVFAVAVHQAATELAVAGYLPERTGPRQRVPLFDVPALRDFLGSPARRLFLAELLASYARISSGVTWTRTRQGWRRRRWNDLDPMRLAVLLEAAPEPEKAGIWRRLGDAALFLGGVFPDHAMRSGLGADALRMARLTGVAESVDAVPVDADGLAQLEWFGARWYRIAAERAVFATNASRLLRDQAEHFREARGILNTTADRYLFPVSTDWFAPPAA